MASCSIGLLLLTILCFCCIFLLLIPVCANANAKPQHRHRRHQHSSSSHHQHHDHRRHILPGHHFMVKKAMNECKVPLPCRHAVESALLNQTQVPKCDTVDYFVMLGCLDSAIMARTNLTHLNVEVGEVCCEIEDVTDPCRQACRSALFAPTLSHDLKQNRIEMVCNPMHGDDTTGDNGLLTCLSTTDDWLIRKNKVDRQQRR